MKRLFYISLPLISAVLLIACSSGGGGGSGSSGVADDAIKTFSSWSAITAPSTVTASNGLSEEKSYTALQDVTGEDVITSLNNLGTSDSSSITISYRADGTIKSITVRTPNTALRWDETNGDIFDESSDVIKAVNNNNTNLGVAVNPINAGWEYQTYGIWLTGIGLGSGRTGAISVGAPTTGSSIPTSGTGLFVGTSHGVYVDDLGYRWLSDSDLSAGVNFFNREVDLSTTNTRITDVSGGSESFRSDLNLSGTLTYQPGVNRFTGPVETSGAPSLTGTSTGQFYGPNAEELGGVFSLSGTGVESYQGAYGAKR